MNEGTRVKILMKNGLMWNGIIREDTQVFLTITDKFNKQVSINKSEISLLEVVS